MRHGRVLGLSDILIAAAVIPCSVYRFPASGVGVPAGCWLLLVNSPNGPLRLWELLVHAIFTTGEVVLQTKGAIEVAAAYAGAAPSLTRRFAQTRTFLSRHAQKAARRYERQTCVAFVGVHKLR